MEHTISQGGGSCGADQWAVLDAAGNQVGPCYDTQQEAQAACDLANGVTDEQQNAGPEWHAWAIAVDTPTSDGREFAADGGGWRDLPLPVMLMTQNDWGHDGARFAGNITLAEMRDGLVYTEGTYAQTPEGEELRGYVERGELRWVSADVMDVGDSELYELLPDGTELPFEPSLDMLFFADESHRKAHGRRAVAAAADSEADGQQAADGERLHDAAEEEEQHGRIVERYLTWKLGGMTVLPFPAFPQCIIAPIDVDLPDAATAAQDAADSLGMAARRSTGLAASAAVPVAPPRDWFANPEFGPPGEDPRLVYDELQDLWACPLTVLPDGQVFGHLAPWEECHVGYEGVCMTAPPSNADYAYFLTGELETAEGDTIAVGQITLERGHPDLGWGYQQAQAAYADTRSAACDVSCGQDEFGVWLAGALRPGISPEQLRTLRASAPSGDWRPIGVGTELIAVVAVNSQGFPIPRRTAHVASVDGRRRQTALVAAGAATMLRLKDKARIETALEQRLRAIEADVARLDTRTAPLRELARDALRNGARP